MTGLLPLDLPALALSLFNAALMLWLGLTVLLNAERRGRAAWGTWLITGSLLLGTVFFISHSALLSLDLNTVSRGLNFWWQVGWWPVLALPLAWYVVVLWYSGFWDHPGTPMRRRQGPWLWASAAALLGMAALVIFANPLPVLVAFSSEFAPPSPARTLPLAGVPLLIWAYPVYTLLCLGLALDALLRPGPSRRALGDLARRRARPWLVAASLILLLVSVLVGGVMLWFTRRLSAAGAASVPTLTQAELLPLAWLDLIIAGLIAVAIVLVGQALVAYEIFTGKSLPRRALLRYWRNAVALAAGFGLVAGFSLAVHLRPIYGVLLSLLLLSGLYALFSWRAYAERERAMLQLRPFVTSQRLYDYMLEPGPAPAEARTLAAASLQALCRDVLGTGLACLAALGPSAPLAGRPLFYSSDGPPAPGEGALDRTLADLAARPLSAQTLLLPVDDEAAGGLRWAVPLWSERGLIGLLLLGDKTDGSLYAQEEIEIARAGGERLVDALASAELARRLLALQRQRLAESQVLDRRARRVLHDDVLPQLHAAMLHLDRLSPPSEAAAPTAEAVRLLGAAHHQVSDLLRDLPNTPAPEVARLGLLPALHTLLEGEFAHTFDAVAWEVEPAAERSAASLAPLAAEVLFYAAREAMRNAARYGRPAGSAAPLHLRLALECAGGGLSLAVEDNGPGLPRDPAASDALSQGTGQGLALHSTLLAVLGGTLTVDSRPAAFTRVTLSLPPTSLSGLATG